MKGQADYIMKPMSMIAIIILLIFLVQSLYSNSGKEKGAEEKLDIVSSATNILLILSNSENCIAYVSPSTLKTQANIIDVNKLDQFKRDYQSIEPECARNYEFGWRAKVEEIGSATTWEFGAKGFSSGKSLKNQVEFWIPVAIRYSENDVRLGKITLNLAGGELEELAGFLDWVCEMGSMGRMTSASTEMRTSYPVTYDSSKNDICVGESCREIKCKLRYFEGFKTAGVHTMTVNYKQGNILSVGQ